ncbi:MAG: VWA domain-containing protein [Marmoricola sp.]
MRRPRRFPWLSALAALFGLVLLTGPAALAAGNGGSPTLTDVHVRHGHVDALVTVPGGDATKAIDRGSLRVRLGSGRSVAASVTPVGHERRAAMVVIDTSGSMAGNGLAAAKSAAATFLGDVPADVEVGLAGFAHRPRVLVAPTTDRARVGSAVRTLRAKGSTSLYDAIDLATRALGASGSRTVVLLSDGADSSSRADLRQAVRRVRASGERLAVVGFHTDATQNGVLRSIARAGGGSVTTALGSASLRKAFGSAAQTIATQVRVQAPVPSGVGGHQPLTVSGTAGGAAFSAHEGVSLPPAAAPAPSSVPPTPHVAPAPRHTLLWVAAGAVFAGLLVLVLAAAWSAFTPQARRRIRSLDSYVGQVAHRASPAGVRNASQDLTGGALRAADAFIRTRKSADRTARTAMLLERADLPMRLNEWYVVRVAMTVALVAVFSMLLSGSLGGLLVAVLLGVLVGAVIPPMVLNFLAKRRARKFEVQLPDVLVLVASSLSTGFSLPQALDGIVRDAPEPSAKEFARALAETRIGTELEVALERTATRMASTNLSWTTMAIRIQRNVGGNLAETLRTTAHTLRERESLRRQVRALSAEGRLSMWILLAVPILMAGYLFFVNRPYLALLWQRPLGMVMLAVSAVMLAVGYFWMRKVVEVKV